MEPIEGPNHQPNQAPDNPSDGPRKRVRQMTAWLRAIAAGLDTASVVLPFVQSDSPAAGAARLSAMALRAVCDLVGRKPRQ